MKTEVWDGSIVRGELQEWAALRASSGRKPKAKTDGSTGPKPPSYRELLEEGPGLSLRFLLDDSRRTMRIFDFRAGVTDAKRARIDAVAVREGMVKLFAVAPREETATWAGLGFEREALLPSFYRRTDGFVFGKLAGARIRYLPDARDDFSAPLHEEAAGTIATARELAKELRTTKAPLRKLVAADEATARRAVDALQRTGKALTQLAPFGRDVVREFWLSSARKESAISVESQACFGNALIEPLRSPEGPGETGALSAAIASLLPSLASRAFASAFTLAPLHNVELAAAFVANGFRPSGVLRSHVIVGGKRTCAIVLSRRLVSDS